MAKKTMRVSIARVAASTAIIASALAAAAPPQGKAQASARPRYGGVAVIAADDPLLVIDPSHASTIAERAFSGLVFEPLLESSRGRDPLPVLATSWEANADSTVWTLQLDAEARFHDGSRLTAADAVYSLLRVARSSGPNPYRWPLRNLATVEVEAGGGEVDTETTNGDEVRREAIVLRFNRPEPRAPLMLSCPGLAVVKAPQSGGSIDGFSYDEAPPGTGPFEIPHGDETGAKGTGRDGRALRGRERGTGDPDGTRRSSGASAGLRLAAFDGHRLGRPFLDAVTWRFSDFEDAVIELQAGALDVVMGFPSPSTSGLGGGSIHVTKHGPDFSEMLYLACNPTGALRNSEDRCRALKAVDRRSMMRSIVGPAGTIAPNLIPATPYSWPWKEWDKGDGEAGGARTQGAGTPAPVAGGATLRLIAPSWHKTAGEVADRIQVDLMAAGFSVSLRKLGKGEMKYKLHSGEFDLLLGLWEPDRWLYEKDWLFSHFWETQIAPIPALASALQSSGGDDGSAPPAFEERLAEECLMLPLFHLDTVALTGRRFAATPGPWGLPDLPWSWIKSGSY